MTHCITEVLPVNCCHLPLHNIDPSHNGGLCMSMSSIVMARKTNYIQNILNLHRQHSFHFQYSTHCIKQSHRSYCSFTDFEVSVQGVHQEDKPGRKHVVSDVVWS